MKCEDVESLVISYLDNELDEKSQREVEKHIESCERCLDELMSCQKVLNLMQNERTQKPADSLRVNFYHMLHGEIARNRTAANSGRKEHHVLPFLKAVVKIAAGLALFIAGTGTGVLLMTRIKLPDSGKEISKLRSEIDQLKRNAIFAMLKEGYSSFRIQAVGYADELRDPDENVLSALITTLNNDKNVNVRMAAAYALSRFAGQKIVRDSLVQSLSKQTDPILQVTLINILVECKEKGAIIPMEQIEKDSATLKEVKQVAERGIKTLL